LEKDLKGVVEEGWGICVENRVNFGRFFETCGKLKGGPFGNALMTERTLKRCKRMMKILSKW
jgi:hypothetical protein